jgi:hypothetical protein
LEYKQYKQRTLPQGMSSFSPTSNGGRNTLNRFSPVDTQLDHGRSQTSTRVVGSPFYGKIDQLNNKKKITFNDSPYDPMKKSASTTKMSPTKLPFGNLHLPSSTERDPTLTASMKIQPSPKMYDQVRHPIAYTIQSSQKDRLFATSWDALISNEPTIARHTNFNAEGTDGGGSRSHSSDSQQFRPVQTDSYEWQGPKDETLDTQLWRDSEEVDTSLENSFRKCYSQTQKMTTREQEERRRRHLEVRRKKRIELEKSRETSPKKLSTGNIIINHDAAAGERHELNRGKIWTVGSNGEMIGFADQSVGDSANTDVKGGRLIQRRKCEKNTGTFRSKEWGAGGGGKFEPIGETMHHGNHAASSCAPEWMTSNREKRGLGGTLLHHKDRVVSSKYILFCVLLSFFF